MVRFDPTKKEITLDEIKEITIPLFKKYGFKSAYLYGYYAENTEIQDIDMEFIVEHTEKTELMTLVKVRWRHSYRFLSLTLALITINRRPLSSVTLWWLPWHSLFWAM